jgi:hypothetical protein
MQIPAIPTATFVLSIEMTTWESLAMLQYDNEFPEQEEAPIFAKQLCDAIKFEPTTVIVLLT